MLFEILFLQLNVISHGKDFFWQVQNKKMIK